MKLSAELRVCMDMALAEARQRRHEFSTVEHLLYAFLHDEDTKQIIKSAGANVEKLRAALDEHLENDLPKVPDATALRVHPSLGFSRVVQRAALDWLQFGTGRLQSHKLRISGKPPTIAINITHQQPAALVCLSLHGKARPGVGLGNHRELDPWPRPHIEAIHQHVQHRRGIDPG